LGDFHFPIQDLIIGSEDMQNA